MRPHNPQKPSAPNRVTATPTRRPPASPPLLSSQLSLFLSTDSSVTTSVLSSPPAPQSTRPTTTTLLCRALTPPDYLYGGWAGSGPGTGRKPCVHRGSGVDARSMPQSITGSSALTAALDARCDSTGAMTGPGPALADRPRFNALM